MRAIFFLAVFISFITACQSNAHDTAAQKAAVDSANFTTVKWLDSIVQFGTINKGEKIQIKFRLLNTGTKPLVITNARPGCGCTIADYTKEPIAPGTQGIVTASFNTEHINTPTVRKTIIVNTNTKNGSEHYLYFEGNINGVESNDKIVQPHPLQEKKG
ncbi:MAG: DUF1573 domain-containing protein [Bacteroidota bacterium]|nr:DUF1573 domain-containing protein [Bacteroidota bacterium]